MKISIDAKRIKAASRKAFADTALIIAGEFTKAITDPVYTWPRGESPRDIVDTGRLRSSQRFEISGMTATYVWPVEYSLAVHNGARMRNGTVQPARRWTVRAFQARPPDQIYQTLLPRYL